MTEATAPNIVPMIPGEGPEPAPVPSLKHYQDRKTKDPLCGAERGESGFARGWKKVTCEDCITSKREPGRPTTDKKTTAKKPTVIVPTPDLDKALAAEVTILLSAFVITPMCIKQKKGPPPAELVAEVGPAVVEVLDHYGFKDQFDHPGIKLALISAGIAFSIHRAPVIENQAELMKAHGIEEQNPT